MNPHHRPRCRPSRTPLGGAIPRSPGGREGHNSTTYLETYVIPTKWLKLPPRLTLTYPDSHYFIFLLPEYLQLSEWFVQLRTKGFNSSNSPSGAAGNDHFFSTASKSASFYFFWILRGCDLREEFLQTFRKLSAKLEE